MSTAIKRRRGTTAEHATFTGLEGEITVDTTKKVVVVHDGATAGGFPMAKESQIPASERLLPIPGEGDASKAVVVNGTEDGFNLTTVGDMPKSVYDPDNRQLPFATVADVNLLSGFRNLIINPLGINNQREESGTVILSAGNYGHDRFKAGASGCTYTFSTNNGVTTFNISAGTLVQIIEASCFAGRGGEYFLSWQGTAQGRIDSGLYGDSGEVSSICDGSGHVGVEWGTGTLSLPQFERGFVTEFSGRHIQQELALCQRYFQKTFLEGVSPGNNKGFSGAIWNSATSLGNVVGSWEFSVPLRVSTYTLTTFNPGGGTAGAWTNTSESVSASVSLIYRGERGVSLTNATNASLSNNFCAIHATAEAEL